VPSGPSSCASVWLHELYHEPSHYCTLPKALITLAFISCGRASVWLQELYHEPSHYCTLPKALLTMRRSPFLHPTAMAKPFGAKADEEMLGMMTGEEVSRMTSPEFASMLRIDQAPSRPSLRVATRIFSPHGRKGLPVKVVRWITSMDSPSKMKIRPCRATAMLLPLGA
jgi:hypothetical protein